MSRCHRPFLARLLAPIRPGSWRGAVHWALPSRRRRGGQPLSAWLGLWALTVQVLVPLGQGIPFGVTADGTARSLVICSANGGLRTIPMPTALSSGAQAPSATASPLTATTPSTTAHSLCIVCLSYAAGGHLAVPPPIPLPVPRALTLASIDTALLAILSHGRLGLPQPRAPPLVA